MSTSKTELIIIEAVCKFLVIAIDAVSSYALYSTVLLITEGENANSSASASAYAIGWAVVFFVLNYTFERVSNRYSPERVHSFVLSIHAVKLAVAFFEAVILLDKFGHAHPIDLSVAADKIVTITEIIHRTVYKDPAFIVIAVCVIYGLDIMAGLLPSDLRHNGYRRPVKIAANDGTTFPLTVDLPPDTSFVTITYKQTNWKSKPNRLCIRIFDVSSGQPVSAERSIPQLGWSGSFKLLIKNGNYTIHIKNHSDWGMKLHLMIGQN